MTGIYKIADRVVLIDSLFGGIHNMCRDYEFDGKPEISIKISTEDIDRERNISSKETTSAYPDWYLETLAVYRMLSGRLLEYDTFLFHGSAIELDGEAYLFTAVSGTGKSTHTRLWRELYGDRAVMINDDKPLIKVENGRAIVYGTPWDGKHRLSTNKSSPLKAVCILERGAENRITPVSRDAAFATLFTQTYRPDDGRQMAKTLELVDKLSRWVELYRLECNMDIEAARVSYEGMKKGGKGE